jgi:hypothetical protein
MGTVLAVTPVVMGMPVVQAALILVLVVVVPAQQELMEPVDQVLNLYSVLVLLPSMVVVVVVGYPVTLID